MLLEKQKMNKNNSKKSHERRDFKSYFIYNYIFHLVFLPSFKNVLRNTIQHYILNNF